jgi:hypothetical protein
VYHVPHPDGPAHGGAAVIIRTAITHHELLHHQLDKIKPANIQVDANPCSFTISAISFPPRHAISAEEYTVFFQSLGATFLTDGKWNAKHKEWEARLVTPKGINLLHAINRQNYKYFSTGERTYWPSDPNKLPDLLTSLYFTT